MGQSVRAAGNQRTHFIDEKSGDPPDEAALSMLALDWLDWIEWREASRDEGIECRESRCWPCASQANSIAARL